MKRSDPKDLADRGVHLDLREVLGNEGAPDLADEILRRHRERAAASSRESKLGWRRPLLAACVLLGVGAVVAVSVMSGESRDGGAMADVPLAPTLDPSQKSVGPEAGEQDPQSPDPQPQDPENGVEGALSGETLNVVLANGVRVLVRSVPGSGQIGMQTVYNVGFLHEPEGLTQASHLLEHIVCNGATDNYGPGESYALLNLHGTVNAETLPEFTHYDYLLPQTQLDLALKIERERLTSLKITKELIEQEAPRCDQEVEFVAANTQSGMLKHGFMALAQGWRHGAERASIRGGMQHYDVDALRDFHRRMYRPSNLTVVIVGDVDANGALALVRHHLEGIAEPAQPLPPAVAFAGLPAKREMAWDGSVRAVCLCWEPPTAAADRVSLALLGGELQRALSNDAAVAGATDCVFASNWIWGVGELPFFVYATASGSTTLPELEALLRGKVQAFLGAANVRPKQNALSAAALLGRIDQITSKYVELMASRFRRPGQGDTEGVRMVLGQSALNWDVSVRRVGRNGIRDLQQLSQEEAQRVLVPLTPERCKVTYLIPE